jgi:hypothetical protein
VTGGRGPRPTQIVNDDGEVLLELDLLSTEARDQLSRWKPEDQQLFAELLQDAPSELQQEMLKRALAAGHRPAELHAFSDEIRPLSDEEVFDACTLSDEANANAARSVVMRLRAESDPIYGFELNGHALTPQPEVNLGPGYELGPRGKPAPGLMVPVAHSPVAPQPRGFEAESSVARGKKLDLNDLGVSAGARVRPPPAAPAASSGTQASTEGRFAEDLMNEAVRALGVSFREQAVDGPQLKLEKAIEAAHAALMKGVPVPVILGPSPGEYRRYALMLQVQTTGKSRAFQMHDPFTQETVWVNEGDLLARTELPFATKTHRRITAIALPILDRKLL